MNQILRLILWDNQVFEELLMNPAGLGLVQSVLGHKPWLPADTRTFRQTVTQEALARNPIRFAGLMDVYGAFPFGKDDVDAERLVSNVNSGAADMAPYRSLFDREPAGDTVSLRPDYAYETFDRAGWEAQKKARMARSPLRNEEKRDE